MSLVTTRKIVSVFDPGFPFLRSEKSPSPNDNDVIELQGESSIQSFLMLKERRKGQSRSLEDSHTPSS